MWRDEIFIVRDGALLLAALSVGFLFWSGTGDDRSKSEVGWCVLLANIRSAEATCCIVDKRADLKRRHNDGSENGVVVLFKLRRESFPFLL